MLLRSVRGCNSDAPFTLNLVSQRRSLSLVVNPTNSPMSVERDKMIAALKKHVVPVLKAQGFEGSFPHFRRPTGTAIHLLTFQFDKWGGGFVVEIATCPPVGFTTHWGEHIPPTKIRAWDINHRLRLGAPDENSDGHWFRYGRGEPALSDNGYEKVARELLPYLSGQAASWWRKTHTHTTSR